MANSVIGRTPQPPVLPVVERAISAAHPPWRVGKICRMPLPWGRFDLLVAEQDLGFERREPRLGLLVGGQQ